MSWTNEEARNMTFDEWNSCKRKVCYGHKRTAKRAVCSMRAKGILNLKHEDAKALVERGL